MENGAKIRALSFAMTSKGVARKIPAPSSRKRGSGGGGAIGGVSTAAAQGVVRLSRAGKDLTVAVDVGQLSIKCRKAFSGGDEEAAAWFATSTEAVRAFRDFLLDGSKTATAKQQHAKLGTSSSSSSKPRAFVCIRQNRWTGIRYAVLMGRLSNGQVRALSFQERRNSSKLRDEDLIKRAVTFARSVAFRSWRDQETIKPLAQNNERNMERALKHPAAFSGIDKVDCSCGKNRSRGQMVPCEVCGAREHLECLEYKQMPVDHTCSACLRAMKEEVVVINMDEQEESRLLTPGGSMAAAYDLKPRRDRGDDSVCCLCGCEDNEDFDAMIQPCKCDGDPVLAHRSCLALAMESTKDRNKHGLPCQACGRQGGISGPEKPVNKRTSRRTTINTENPTSKGVKRLRSALAHPGRAEPSNNVPVEPETKKAEVEPSVLDSTVPIKKRRIHMNSVRSSSPPPSSTPSLSPVARDDSGYRENGVESKFHPKENLPMCTENKVEEDADDDFDSRYRYGSSKRSKAAPCEQDTGSTGDDSQGDRSHWDLNRYMDAWERPCEAISSGQDSPQNEDEREEISKEAPDVKTEESPVKPSEIQSEVSESVKVEPGKMEEAEPMSVEEPRKVDETNVEEMEPMKVEEREPMTKVDETKVDKTESIKVDETESMKVGETESMKVDETESMKVDEFEPTKVKVEETEPPKVEETEPPTKVDETETMKVDETETMKVEETEPTKVEQTEPMKVDAMEIEESEPMKAEEEVPVKVEDGKPEESELIEDEKCVEPVLSEVSEPDLPEDKDAEVQSKEQAVGTSDGTIAMTEEHDTEVAVEAGTTSEVPPAKALEHEEGAETVTHAEFPLKTDHPDFKDETFKDDTFEEEDEPDPDPASKVAKVEEAEKVEEGQIRDWPEDAGEDVDYGDSDEDVKSSPADGGFDGAEQGEIHESGTDEAAKQLATDQYPETSGRVDYARSRSKGRYSGWDQLPEGFENAEDALRASRDYMRRRPTGWSGAPGAPGLRPQLAVSGRVSGFDNRYDPSWGRRSDIYEADTRFFPRDFGRGRSRGGASPMGRREMWMNGPPPGQWTGPKHLPSPPSRFTDAVGFGPANAAAVAAAKVESSGFMVAPDGTITKAGSPGAGVRAGPGRPFPPPGRNPPAGMMLNPGRNEALLSENMAPPPRGMPPLRMNVGGMGIPGGLGPRGMHHHPGYDTASPAAGRIRSGWDRRDNDLSSPFGYRRRSPYRDRDHHNRRSRSRSFTPSPPRKFNRSASPRSLPPPPKLPLPPPPPRGQRSPPAGLRRLNENRRMHQQHHFEERDQHHTRTSGWDLGPGDVADITRRGNSRFDERPPDLSRRKDAAMGSSFRSSSSSRAEGDDDIAPRRRRPQS